MESHLLFLRNLSAKARQSGHRFLVRLKGDQQWNTDVIGSFIKEQKYGAVTKLGGDKVSFASCCGYKEGHQLLGREMDSLIYDATFGFDANSFTAASGALRGGGLLFLILPAVDNVSYQWLDRSLSEMFELSPEFVPVFSVSDPKSTVPCFVPDEQQEAIEKVIKVLEGHRKRPLVLTADRGRGKSSALGMAAARILKGRNARILVTAPSRKSVDPLFHHASTDLRESASRSHNEIETKLSRIAFISPDELLRSLPECDLLMVDEASAVPIPMLIKIVEHYHRVVFSSTIHGYEGCGRGFTLKFMRWLDENRPGWSRYHIKQPVRWSSDDPLEKWMFSTFLLDAEFEPALLSEPDQYTGLKFVSRQELLSGPVLFRQCFSLLVSAHYQTSPNDLIQMLDDPEVNLFCFYVSGIMVGCLVVKQEGGLSDPLIEDVMAGKRRPRGHLAPVMLAGQMGLTQAAKQTSLRVMRIAVAIELQGKGYGSKMLSSLKQQSTLSFDYLTTSFGVTPDLVHFWSKNGFRAARLGVRRDQASGTHSLLMYFTSVSDGWFEEAATRFSQDFIALLPDTFSELSPDLVLALLKTTNPQSCSITSAQQNTINRYIEGGSSFESVVYPLTQCLLSGVNEDDIDPMLVSRLLQRKSWKEIASLYSFTGRKQAEEKFRSLCSRFNQFTV